MTPGYDRLLQAARSDPRILAFWLDGSRGKGFATEHSDYDCTMVVSDEAAEAYRVEYTSRGGEIDCRVMTLDEFRAYAGWDTAQRYDRYNFAHLRAIVDKTGEVQGLIDEKGRVPPEIAVSFIDSSLDHTINQIYRAMKCLRDGNGAAARLEAVEVVAPMLDALFALNEGRLRPYYKYLQWELTERPLAQLPWRAYEVPQRLTSLLDPASRSVLRETLLGLETLFRKNRHGDVFNAWGDALDWMKTPSDQ
jgi:hypothetical protein